MILPSVSSPSSRAKTALFRGAEHNRARRTPLYGFCRDRRPRRSARTDVPSGPPSTTKCIRFPSAKTQSLKAFPGGGRGTALAVDESYCPLCRPSRISRRDRRLPSPRIWDAHRFAIPSLRSLRNARSLSLASFLPILGVCSLLAKGRGPLRCRACKTPVLRSQSKRRTAHLGKHRFARACVSLHKNATPWPFRLLTRRSSPDKPMNQLYLREKSPRSG